MDNTIAFTDCPGRVYGIAAPNRPSLRVLHTLPAGIRHQVHLAYENERLRPEDGLLLATGLPDLQWSRVHEVIGASALAFAFHVTRQSRSLSRPHPIFLVGSSREIHSLRPEGLSSFVPPASLSLIEATRRTDRFWTAEQCLAAKAQALVILHLDQGPNLSESRSLQIAAERGGSLGLVLISKRAQSSACQTRWSCEPTHDGWVWELVKNKSGRVGCWNIRAGPDGQLLDPIPSSQLKSTNLKSPHETAPHSASVVSLPSAGSSDPCPRPSS